MHAGLAVKRVHGEPRIVREHGQAAAGRTSGLRLDARVAFERIGVLGRVGVQPQLAQRAELPTGKRKRRGYLLSLVRVVAGDDDSLHTVKLLLLERLRYEGNATRPTRSMSVRNTRAPKLRNSSTSSPVV